MQTAATNGHTLQLNRNGGSLCVKLPKPLARDFNISPVSDVCFYDEGDHIGIYHPDAAPRNARRRSVTPVNGSYEIRPPMEWADAYALSETKQVLFTAREDHIALTRAAP